MTAAIKTAALPAPTLPAPLLAPWAAFVAAGACAVVAADLAVSVPTWAATYAELGVELPWLTRAVLDGGRAVPAALVGASIGLLSLGGVRVERRRWRGRAGELASLAAGVALLAAGGLFGSTMLAFFQGKRALQQ